MSSRPDVYYDNGLWNFRASGLGACIRGLVAARLGIRPQPPKVFLQKHLQASSEAESTVVDILAQKGWVITEQQKPVELVCPEGRITGHLDGMAHGKPLEIKAFGKTLFEKYVKGGLNALGPPFTQMYGMQITAYGLALQQPVQLVVFRKDDQDGNLGQYIEKVYDTLPYDLDVLCGRMKMVLDYAQEVANGGPWPECDAGCSSGSWYWHIHTDKPKGVVNDAELVEKVEKAKQLKVTLNVLEEEYKKISTEVKQLLGPGSHEVGRMDATVSKKIRTLTDLDKMRQEMGDEFMAQYAYEQTSISLTIRERKGT